MAGLVEVTEEAVPAALAHARASCTRMADAARTREVG
jgi:hypothetical protein